MAKLTEEERNKLEDLGCWALLHFCNIREELLDNKGKYSTAFKKSVLKEWKEIKEKYNDKP